MNKEFTLGQRCAFINVQVQPSPNRWSTGVFVAPQGITDNAGTQITDNAAQELDTNPSR